MLPRHPSPGSPSLYADPASRSAGCPLSPQRPLPCRRPTQRCDSSVVFLENNLLAIEAQTLQDGSHVVHHGFQAADVDIQIAPFADGFEQMYLHVARTSAPGRLRTAEGGPKIEIRVKTRQFVEFLAIVNAVFVTDSEDQRQPRGLGMA